MHHKPTQYMQPERNIQVFAYPIKCPIYIQNCEITWCNWNAHLKVFAWNYHSEKWKPAFHEHFTAIKIFKRFVGSDPFVAGCGQYSPFQYRPFQNVLWHFSSSIRTWVIGQNVGDMSSLEIQFIVDCSCCTTEMVLEQILQDPKIKMSTWLSAQLARSLGQVTGCHLYEAKALIQVRSLTVKRFLLL